MTGAKSTDAILEPPADHQKQELQVCIQFSSVATQKYVSVSEFMS